MLRIGQTVSDVRLKTTAGEFGMHEYFRDSWGLLVCYVSDFSAVCAGEISRLVNDFHEFAIRNVKILGMSCDSIDSHVKWIEDIKEISGIKSDKGFPFPIVSDSSRVLSAYFNVLNSKCRDEDGIPLPCRATFVLTPDMTIQLIHFYPQSIGRNFDEIIRSIDALQLTFKFNNDISTPCGWKPSMDLLISTNVSEKKTEKGYSSSTGTKLPSGKDYIRVVSSSETIIDK